MTTHNLADSTARAFRTSGKSTIVVVLKYTGSFVTPLNGLDLSPCFSVLVVNTPDGEPFKITPDVREHFDAVCIIENEYPSTFERTLLGNLKLIELPLFQEFMVNLLDKAEIEAKNMFLVVLEEEMVRPAAKIRDQLGLPGLKWNDVQRFCNKPTMIELMKSAIEQNEGFIATVPKSIVLQLDDKFDLQSIATNIEIDIDFPMILKPSDGCASIGVRKCSTHDELLEHLQTAYDHREQTPTIIVQEFIKGDEYTVFTLVKNANIYIQRVHRSHLPMFSTASGHVHQPLAEINIDRESECFDYKQLCFATAQIGRAMTPMPDGNFWVQFMKRGADWCFIECAARVPGDVAPRFIEMESGVNVEVAQIMLSVPPTREAFSCTPTKRRNVVDLLYPLREGTLKGFRPLPQSIRSEVHTEWWYEPGAKLGASRTYDDALGAIMLVNEDYEELVRDFQTLIHFDPFDISK